MFWLHENLCRVRELLTYQSEDDAVDAFWRTLIANQIRGESENATLKYRRHFKSWWKGTERLVESTISSEELSPAEQSEWLDF